MSPTTLWGAKLCGKNISFDNLCQFLKRIMQTQIFQFKTGTRKPANYTL